MLKKTFRLRNDSRKIKLIAEALSNEKRLQLIQLIKDAGEDTSHKKLADDLQVRSSSISFHLSSLIDAGIVSEQLGKGLRGRNKKVPVLKINKIVIEL